MKKSQFIHALIACGLMGPAAATEFIKETQITWLTAQADRPVQTVTENRDVLTFAVGSTWEVNGGTGGGNCPENGAVLPLDNAIMRAIAIAAVTSGQTVQVAVDNSLPTVAGYCTISMLSIRGS